MPHREVRQRLIWPYVAYLAASVSFVAYQPPTLAKLADTTPMLIWHAELMLGAVTALYGGAYRREVPELCGLLLICGSLLAYTVILTLAGVMNGGGPGRYATWGIGLLMLGGLLFAVPRAVALWCDVRQEIRRRRQAHQ